MSAVVLRSKAVWFSRLANATSCPAERALIEARMTLAIRYAVRAARPAV